jgi:hypothetical protein
MEKAWQGWQEHPGARTLVFCCTIAHAGFVGRWLRGRGVRLAVVHSGAQSDDRELALRGLASGELDAVCVLVSVPSDAEKGPYSLGLGRLRQSQAPASIQPRLDAGWGRPL